MLLVAPFVLLLPLMCVLSYSPAEVRGESLRCFCTEIDCVRTNYMCKTKHGSCYSRMIFDQSTGRALSTRHGCDDGGLLPLWERVDTCRGRKTSLITPVSVLYDSSVKTESETDSRDESREIPLNSRRIHYNKTSPNVEKTVSNSKIRAKARTLKNETETNREFKVKPTKDRQQKVLVTCCNEDMCNYGAVVHAASNSTTEDESSLNQGQGNGRPSQEIVERLAPYRYRHQDSDLWFKMAVCAVTVVGAAVLVVIVVGAMRMFRNDKQTFRWNQQHHQQQQRHSYCDCPHHAIDAILIANEVSSKQQLLFPVTTSGACSHAYCKTPLGSPCTCEPQGTT